MRTKLFISLILVFCFTACSSSAQIGTPIRNVSNFNKIGVSSGIDVRFTQSGKYSVSLETDQENLSKVEVVVKNGTLELKRKKGEKFKRNTTVIAHVTAPSLEAIAMSGGSDFKAGKLSSDKPLSIAASGGSDLDVEEISVKECNLAFSGGADCDIQMLKAKEVKVAFSGGSDGEINFDTEKLMVAASGGADLTLGGKAKNATIAASGGADIDIRSLSGENITSNKSGAGSIKKK